MESDSDGAIFLGTVNCFVFGSSAEKRLLLPGLSSAHAKLRATIPLGNILS